jgi:hypothetical protein
MAKSPADCKVEVKHVVGALGVIWDCPGRVENAVEQGEVGVDGAHGSLEQQRQVFERLKQARLEHARLEEARVERERVEQERVEQERSSLAQDREDERLWQSIEKNSMLLSILTERQRLRIAEVDRRDSEIKELEIRLKHDTGKLEERQVTNNNPDYKFKRHYCRSYCLKLPILSLYLSLPLS